MKLTRKQIRAIISEEIENLSYKPGKDTTDISIAHDHPSEAETREDAWAGGQNIHLNIDHQETFGSKEKPTRFLKPFKKTFARNPRILCA